MNTPNMNNTEHEKPLDSTTVQDSIATSLTLDNNDKEYWQLFDYFKNSLQSNAKDLWVTIVDSRIFQTPLWVDFYTAIKQEYAPVSNQQLQTELETLIMQDNYLAKQVAIKMLLWERKLLAVSQNVKINLYIPMYNERNRMRPLSPDNLNGENSICTKLHTMQDLQNQNPHLTFEMILVDDQWEIGSINKIDEYIKNHIIAKEQIAIPYQIISIDDYYTHPEEGSTYVPKNMWNKRDPEALNKSRKWGAVVVALRHAYHTNKDTTQNTYALTTDLDNSVDLYNIWHLLENQLETHADMVQWSRRMMDSVAYIEPQRNKIGRMYLFFLSKLFPTIPIKDVNRWFTMYNTKSLDFMHDQELYSYIAYNQQIEIPQMAINAWKKLQEVGISYCDSLAESNFAAQPKGNIAWRAKDLLYISKQYNNIDNLTGIYTEIEELLANEEDLEHFEQWEISSNLIQKYPLFMAGINDRKHDLTKKYPAIWDS